MNDKELAGKIVASGLQREHFYLNMLRPTNEEFVRDWRVAGALMEKMESLGITKSGNSWFVSVNWDFTDAEPSQSLPRAIIEACVDALAEDET